MKLGIVGSGVVGSAIARSYLEFHEVRIYDQVKEKCTHPLIETSKHHGDGVLDSDLVFLCLPTPKHGNSLYCDTSIIDLFFQKILDCDDATANERRSRCFVLKSTVPIGTTSRLRKEYGLTNLLHSPEFLTARCAVVDAQIPSRNVIGIPGRGGKTIQDHWLGLGRLEELYTRRFVGVPLFITSSEESEAAKLILNSFFAVKVSFFNEMRSLADKLGLGWDSIMEVILSDGRVAHSHTKVPGPDGSYGWGGACLGKDSANIITLLKDNNLSCLVTEGAYNRNLEDRKK